MEHFTGGVCAPPFALGLWFVTRKKPLRCAVKTLFIDA